MRKKKVITKVMAMLLSFAVVFSMMPGVVFADEVASSPVAETTIVSSAAELAALGGKEVEGIVELAADIDMSGTAMEPIKRLKGTFEGNGYTVSNLSLSGEAGSSWKDPNVGLGLIALLDGTAQNLKVDNVKITSSSKSKIYAGAIVGLVEGTTANVVNCTASGVVTLPEASTQDGAGGIVGGVLLNGTLNLSGVWSNVDITNGKYTGGLLGIAQYAKEINLENCAAVGDLKVGTGGGIIGWLTSIPVSAKHVYYGGKISGTTKNGFAYNKNYNNSNLTVESVYFDSDKNKGSSWSPFEGVTTTNCLTGTIDGKSTEELKALKMTGLTKVDGFDGYPVPEWLRTLGSASHNVTVKAEKASKVILSKDGADTEMTAGEGGTFTASLAEGKYTFKAETEAADKEGTTGTLVVGKTDKTMTVTLPNKVADTVITIVGLAEGKTAKLTVYQGSDESGAVVEAKAEESGVYTYALKEGTYFYKAEAEEYKTETGTFTVPAENSAKTVTMIALPKFDVTFKVNCGEATAVIKVTKGENIYTAKEDDSNVYSLSDGDYEYEVSAKGYLAKSGKITVNGATKTVDVALDAVKGDGSKENPFIIDSKAALVNFADRVNEGVKEYVTGYAKLDADVNLENMSWTPIGKNWADAYKGSFDGGKHTISGLNVTTARTYYGFFGCLNNATVENLTLKGQVYCSEPYARVGGLSGYAIGDVTIKNCASAVNVSALARGCDGLGGLVGGYEDGVEYKWEDHKMLIQNSYNAGNVICTGTDANATIGGLVGGNKNCVQLENCYNVGTVYGPGVQAAGLIGNAGYQTGDNCKPSMDSCYNAGKVVGAEGKTFGLYSKGTIAESNVKNCFVEEGSAADNKNGTQVVTNEAERQAMVEKLGSGWTIDAEKNNGLPHLSGTNPIAADTALVDELGKHADVVSVATNAAIGTKIRTLKDGATAGEGIAVKVTQSKDDIRKGYLETDDNTLKLAKKNESGAAVTETATLSLTRDGITLFKPISVVIYPAADKMGSLMDSIAKTYQNKSDEWVVFDMVAYAGLNGKTVKTSEAAKENYINLIINELALNSASASDRAKGELILGALGIDTTKLTPYGSEESYNNAAKLQAMNMNVSYYVAPWILLADKQGNVKLTNEQVQKLVKILTDSQGANGLCQGAYWGKSYDDVDTTGTALAALARFVKATEDPYGVRDAASTFTTKALEGLKKAQGENGSFGNVNSDAMVIAGLAAVGENPREFKKNGNSLADALTLYANSGQTGFTSTYADGEAGEKAEALATEQGFRALVVLEKLNEGAGSYNIYSGKMGDAAANPVPAPEEGKTEGTATGTGKVENNSGKPEAGENAKNIVVGLTVSPDGSNEWITAAGYTLAEGSTAYDLITKALAASGMSCIGADKNYITAVSKGSITLANFDKGPNSGWLYSVNGALPNVGIQDYILKNGDSVKLYYVEDWTKDSQAGAWTGTNNEVITTGNTGSAITTVPTEVKISGKTAAATVTDENAAELIKQAKENKSAEIVINVSSSDAKDAETVNLELDKKTVESIVKDTEATVTVKTPAGEINLDKETLKQIAGEAEGNKISIEITKVSKPEEAQKKLVGANGQIFKLAVKSGNKVISKFKGTVTVRLAVPAALKDKNIAAVHIEGSALEKLEGRRITQNKVEFYEFKTPHFSEVALVDTAEVKLDSDDKNDSADKAKSLIKELKLKAVSSKTAKKNVKVTVKMNSKNNTLIKELSDMGYTVKYRYYRSVKKASKYTAVKTKTSKTYINTKGKRGSKYYYKVRAVVYDGDKVIAQSALKQCKYAVRTWSK